tara:strand:+ start:7248 stop:7502 length:255 start_codon:yes stop_codon:yes gene_type:complete
MNKKNIIEDLVKFLEREKKIPFKFKKDIENFEYLRFNQIDSIGLINFILWIEKKYKIKLKIKDKESKEFRTVGGLANIIFKKLN